LNKYHGVAGQENPRTPGNGAGHAEDDLFSLVADRIEENQQSNIRHEGVDVPRHTTPWGTQSAHARFCTALAEVKRSKIVPQNFGMLPEEWDVGGYPVSEVVPLGRWGGKVLDIALPIALWKPRAVVWCQALEVLTCIQDMMDQ
jgi:hypothetical protein